MFLGLTCYKPTGTVQALWEILLSQTCYIDRKPALPNLHILKYCINFDVKTLMLPRNPGLLDYELLRHYHHSWPIVLPGHSLTKCHSASGLGRRRHTEYNYYRQLSGKRSSIKLAHEITLSMLSYLGHFWGTSTYACQFKHTHFRINGQKKH